MPWGQRLLWFSWMGGCKASPPKEHLSPGEEWAPWLILSPLFQGLDPKCGEEREKRDVSAPSREEGLCLRQEQLRAQLLKGDSHHHSAMSHQGKTRQELWFCSVSLLKIHSYLPLCNQVSAVVQVQSSSSHSSPRSCWAQCCSLILTQFPWETRGKTGK